VKAFGKVQVVTGNQGSKVAGSARKRHLHGLFYVFGRRESAPSKPIGVKTARAWAINDLFCWFWRHVYSKIAHRFFKE